jgi:DNA-binding GntR family transcriptional regulator
MAVIAKEKSLSEQIVDVMFLKKAFDDNPLTERFLSERFKTSRTPIRDALKTLENDDLIERKKKKGVYLKRPTPKVIAELYDLRIVLEGFAVRLASQNATEEDLKELEKAAKDFAKAQTGHDYVQSEHANVAFHQNIIRLSANEMLIKMLNNINIIRKAFQYSYSLRPDRQAVGSPYSHQDIIQKLRDRDADASENLMRNHIQIGKQRMIEQALGFKMNTMEAAAGPKT